MNKIISTVLLFFIACPSFGQSFSFDEGLDSLFIIHVKKYVTKEFGIELKGDFYTKWKANEKIYECLNRYIFQINKRTTNVSSLNANCYKDVQLLLEGENSFQKDRFANGLNNAFLLKNMNYCKNYFLLKRVLMKQGSIMKLLEILKSLPQKPADCTIYLEGFAGKN